MKRTRSNYFGAFLWLWPGFSWPASSEPLVVQNLVPTFLGTSQSYEKRIAELTKQIDEKNKLLQDWLEWKKKEDDWKLKETTLRQELEKAYEDQIASRDDAIKARDLLIGDLKTALAQERRDNIKEIAITSVASLVTGGAIGLILALIIAH